jgi:transglutaminase-like putative cysteine protease
MRLDYFGNTVINICLESPHSELDILADSEVALHPPVCVMPDQTPAWEQVRDRIRQYKNPRDLDTFEFVFASPMVQPNKAVVQWASEVFAPGVPILRGALDLTHRIFNEFAYDPNATSTFTPLSKAFEIKRGVCQDFAHVGIACLRAMGLAARYVSGYLNTQPPPGKSKLVGADASHAWFSIYVPGLGWVDMDPTNDVMPIDQHITLAWGRDYGDVTPVRGTVLGGGNHRLQVAVDVLQQP